MAAISEAAGEEVMVTITSASTHPRQRHRLERQAQFGGHQRAAGSISGCRFQAMTRSNRRTRAAARSWKPA
jgi:hypothetical protein